MRRALLLILALLLLPVLATPARALQIPQPAGYVTDLAGMLSPATVERLDRQLADFEKSDSTQIAVLTVPSLQGDSLDDFSIHVAEQWGIGQKGKDNGALLLIAKKEHRVRIEVGYGLEGRLTDLLCGRIIDYVITPRFKAGDFDGGVSAGVAAMIQAVRGEYKGNGETRRRRSNPWGLLSLLFFFGPGLLFLGGPRSRSGRHRRGGFWIGGPPFGGGFGGGGGGGFGGFGGGGFGGGGASGGW